MKVNALLEIGNSKSLERNERKWPKMEPEKDTNKLNQFFIPYASKTVEKLL